MVAMKNFGVWGMMQGPVGPREFHFGPWPMGRWNLQVETILAGEINVNNEFHLLFISDLLRVRTGAIGAHQRSQRLDLSLSED